MGDSQLTKVRKYWPVGQAVLFNFVWLITVNSATIDAYLKYSLLAQAIFIATSSLLGPYRVVRQCIFIVTLSCYGILADYLALIFGIIEFSGSIATVFGYPIWMIGLWLSFASLLSASLIWLEDKYFLQIAFGAFGGPFSLFIAENMGALKLAQPAFATLPIFSFSWAILLVFAFLLHKNVHPKNLATIGK